MYLCEGSNLKDCDHWIWTLTGGRTFNYNQQKHAKTERDIKWTWGRFLARLLTRGAAASFSHVSDGFPASFAFLSSPSVPKANRASGHSRDCGYITGAMRLICISLQHINLKWLDPYLCPGSWSDWRLRIGFRRKTRRQSWPFK